MLRITAVSTGAVDYLLRGSDCAEHAHAGGAAGQGAGRAPGAAADPAGYLLAGAAKEPAGVWYGEGLAMLDIESGSAASEDQVRAVFGRLEHPSRVDEHGDALPLGSRPRTFRSREDRVAQALAAEPDATEERRAEITDQVFAQTRKAVAYYDFTFSPPKSLSVYWAALLEVGRDAEAANVVVAHRAGVAAAMAYVQRETAYVRSGYHGKTISGQSVGVYEAARGLAWIRWDHSTSRAQQPHLHSHVTVLNRAETDTDGVIRALASRGFGPIKQAADAVYIQTAQRALTATNDVVFALRADGKAAEIVGFTSQLLGKASMRASDVTARRDALVRRFELAHGRVPSPAERKQMDRTAWRDTRAAKNHTVAPRRQIAKWAAPLREELDAALTASAEATEHVAQDGHPDQLGYEHRGREELLAAAVRGVQDRYATWTVGNLAAEIAAEQARTPAVTAPPQDLAAAVLADPDRYGVVVLSARDVGIVPAELRRPDGLSRYRMRNAEVYATATQLGTEAAIVARARSTGATAVTGPARELARVELQAAGLSVDQQAAVLRILSSGRRGDVLIGPAGAGKSRTVGVLARMWQAHTGGRVLGLATSQIATQVLVDDGLTALNTSQFRHRFTPDPHGPAQEQLHAHDLIVLDEAGMSTTAEVDVISALVAQAGAKLLYTGDHEQLAAVGAGGMLELLVRDAGAVELTEIHRFTHPWEREASVRLRAGDPDVVAVYDAHGRLRGGTEQEMTSDAVRGYLADVLDGHWTLLVVRDNATAATLSGQIRAELVAAGRVSAEVLAETRDGNLIGVGDLIQARRNDATLRVDGPGMVTNREVYEVLGHDPLAAMLTVRDRDGNRVHLPAGYVARHTTLAYAVTSYGCQGLNVDTSHNLVDAGTTRAGAYVPGTRGRHANTFYVICRHDPDHHDPERVDRTPVAVLTDVITRPIDRTAAAELERRAGDEESRSLAWVGTQWDLLTAELGRAHATVTLAELVGPEIAQRAVAEPGYARLMSVVRAMELAGHDPDAVLTEAVARGPLHTAASVSDVLRYRIRLADNGGRTPERIVRDGDWTTFTEGWAGPAGDYAHVLAAAATARQTELGERVAADPPAWAVDAATLGPPPEGPTQRAEWVRRAGIVATYRDLHAIPDTQRSIGQAPSRERAFHHALWRHALTALGHPADALDYATASDVELRGMRDAWRRAQTWAPQYVADQLHRAREDAEEYRRDAVIWRVGLDRHPDGSADRDLAERDLAAAEHLAAVTAARVAALEQVQAARTEWVERHRALQERAAFAGDELERRGLDRDTAAPTGDQQELFALAYTDMADTADTTTDKATTSIRAARRDDPAQQQLDLDGVPGTGSAAVSGRDHLTDPLSADPALSADLYAFAVHTQTPTATRDTASAASADEPTAVTGRDLPQATPDGYTALFTDAERAAERERHQPALFDAHPTPADIAAAQPLHPDVPDDRGAAAHAVCGDGESTDTTTTTTEDEDMTVAQATRQAEILASLRADIDARTAAAAPHCRVDEDDRDTSYTDDQSQASQLAHGQSLST